MLGEVLRRERLEKLLAKHGGSLDLHCGLDQVGSLKVLTDTGGRLIKKIHYDSFGVPRSDSLPDLFLPIGFAGGLADEDTGLYRFGWRDYDPYVGRFMAFAPPKDKRGDGDLYDYCVDDPVNLRDGGGLFFGPPMTFGKKVMLRSVGFKLGDIGLVDLLWPPEASSPEQMYDIRQEVLQLEKKNNCRAIFFG